MYPREVKIDDPQLKTWILEKSDMIKKGIETSEWIETVEKELQQIEQEIVTMEEAVDVSDLMEKGKELAEQMKTIMYAMEDIKKQVTERKKAGVSPELIEKYNAKDAQKEELERERNKIALRVQKWKDKIIPRGQEIMKTHLQDRYEDYDTLMVNEQGEVVGSIFSHLEDFKNNFKEKR